MRRIFSVVLCLFAIIFSVFAVQADTSVSMWSENVEIKNNRLFDVDVYVDCSFNLAAATFEISYNNTMMEYREVNTEIDNGMVEAADKDGKVKAIFLKSEGISENNEIKLFSAKFKSISSGVCDLTISMYDCVDENAITLNTETSTQLTVVISGSNSAVVTDNDQKKEKDDSTHSAIEETEGKSVKYLSVVSSDNNEKGYLILLIFMTLVVMGLMTYISMLKKDKKKIIKQQLEEDTKNQNKRKDNEQKENQTEKAK